MLLSFSVSLVTIAVGAGLQCPGSGSRGRGTAHGYMWLCVLSWTKTNGTCSRASRMVAPVCFLGGKCLTLGGDCFVLAIPHGFEELLPALFLVSAAGCSRDRVTMQ